MRFYVFCFVCFVIVFRWKNTRGRIPSQALITYRRILVSLSLSLSLSMWVCVFNNHNNPNYSKVDTSLEFDNPNIQSGVLMYVL